MKHDPLSLSLIDHLYLYALDRRLRTPRRHLARWILALVCLAIYPVRWSLRPA